MLYYVFATFMVNKDEYRFNSTLTVSGLLFLCHFYNTAALLARQSTVLATAIPSVCRVCSSHTGILSKGMKIGSHGLHCEVAEQFSFLIPTMVGGDVPFHLTLRSK